VLNGWRNPVHAGFRANLLRDLISNTRPVRHTLCVPSFLISALCWPIAIIAIGLQAMCQPVPHVDWQPGIRHAAHTAPDARMIVLDIASNRVLAGYHLAESARTLAAPGSTLKPVILYQLLSASRWNPERRIACDRNLMIAGHKLACSHPPSSPFNAREALSWSCNTYFAQLARSLLPGELGRLLRPTGLLGTTGLAVKSSGIEANADFHDPADIERIPLTVLGIEGIRITPFELAAAYRWLALEMAAHPDSIAAQQIRGGLKDSATFGIANAASLGGVSVAGKTGTAEGMATAQTHGWFAGLSPADHPRVVVVVYLPSGRGADAARVAADLLAHARGAQK
jgi:membrane peptidoglycan carboxypeptidase